MAKSKLISRIGALALAAALACTSLISASAATIDKATIDMRTIWHVRRSST